MAGAQPAGTHGARPWDKADRQDLRELEDDGRLAGNTGDSLDSLPVNPRLTRCLSTPRLPGRGRRPSCEGGADISSVTQAGSAAEAAAS